MKIQAKYLNKIVRNEYIEHLEKQSFGEAISDEDRVVFLSSGEAIFQ